MPRGPNDWDGRERKETIREEFFSRLPVLHNILSLPADQALCIQDLQRLGKIAPDAEFLFAESEYDVYQQLKHNVRDLDATIYNCRIEEIWRFPSDKKFDFVNLDFDGTLNDRIYNWLKGMLIPALSEGGSICLTVNKSDRSKFKWITRNFQEKGKKFLEIEPILNRFWSANRRENTFISVLACMEDLLESKNKQYDFDGRIYKSTRTDMMVLLYENITSLDKQ